MGTIQRVGNNILTLKKVQKIWAAVVSGVPWSSGGEMRCIEDSHADMLVLHFAGSG